MSKCYNYGMYVDFGLRSTSKQLVSGFFCSPFFRRWCLCEAVSLEDDEKDPEEEEEGTGSQLLGCK